MIVITGAAGHLGNLLTRTLVEKGYRVRGIVTPRDNLTPLNNLNIDILTGDVRDKKFLLDAFKEAKYVYHLAGIVSITQDQLNLIEEVNVQGTKNVIDACLENNVQRLVYTSSVHALVEEPHGQLITEATAINPDNIVGTYAQSKAKATLAVYDAIERGLAAVIVHPSGIIGPYDYNVGNMGQLIIDYVKGRIPVLINGTYDFVDVRDVVSGTIAACERGRSGENYILSGHQITLKQIFKILENITGTKTPKILFPHWLLKMFIPLVGYISRKLNKAQTLTSYSLYTLSSNSLFSHEKATKELGYFPRHIYRTLEDTVAWYGKIGKL